MTLTFSSTCDDYVDSTLGSDQARLEVLPLVPRLVNSILLWQVWLTGLALLSFFGSFWSCGQPLHLISLVFGELDQAFRLYKLTAMCNAHCCKVSHHELFTNTSLRLVPEIALFWSPRFVTKGFGLEQKLA